MNNETYLKIIRLIFKKYPQIHQYIIQDLHDWLDDRYSLPYTKELREILKEVNATP